MANAMLGIMISTIFKNEAIAMDVSFVYNSPAFVFSGFTFPMMAMPAFSAWYAQINTVYSFFKCIFKRHGDEYPLFFFSATYNKFVAFRFSGLYRNNRHFYVSK